MIDSNGAVRAISGSALVALADDDPRRAIAVAEDLLSAGVDQPLEIFRTLGLAHRVLGDPEGSRHWLDRGLTEAGLRGDPVEEAELMVTLAATNAMLGDFDGAIALLDTVEQIGDLPAQQHAAVQRAGMLARRGRIVEALQIYEQVESVLQRRGDATWLARLLINRGLLRAYAGDLDSSENDLRKSLEICADRELAMLGAMVRHNLGFVLTQRGDLLEALDLYAEAATAFASLDVPNAEFPLDRCETLMYAGLVDDALTIAAETVDDLARRGMREESAEGLLMYARAAEAGASPTTALVAERARAALADLGNRALADAAAVIAIRAESRRDRNRDEMLDQVVGVANQLDARDRRLASATTWLLGSRLAREAGDLERAAVYLDRAEDRIGVSDRAGIPMSLVVELALTGGLLAEARGDPLEASRLARRGLAAVEGVASQIGFGGQQTHVRGCAVDLARLQVRLALTADGNDRLLRWVETGRTRLDRPPQLRRSDDAAVALQLERLRWIHAERAADPEDGDLVVEQAQSERRMQRTVRRVASGAVGVASTQALGSLKNALPPGAVFISWFAPDATLWELKVAEHRSRRRHIGPESAVRRIADQLAFSMGGLALERQDAARSTAQAGKALQAFLAPDVSQDEIVVNPPADLFNVPWSALPSLSDRAITVAPSAAAYLGRGLPNRTTSSTLVVAGPALQRSADEARLVASHHPGVELLDPSTATAASVLKGMSAASVVHFACHAVVRPDNASFSYLRLTDGPLFLYDIERLEIGPDTVVLSACSAARSWASGNQLHGFVTALLRAGARTVIAPIAPVPDSDETLRLVDRLHFELADGARPAAALRRARSFDSDLSTYTSHAFQCFGWG